jgi:hypothetical protein
MMTWTVYDHNGIRPMWVGEVQATDYDEALILALDYWPGRVAEVEGPAAA